MRLDDGHSTIVTIANIPTAKFYEKEVTPAGLSGGGPIDTTTMRNIAYRTQSPKQLKTVSAMTIVAAYDPSVYPQVRDQIQVNQLITLTFPDGSTWVFWGWLDEFTPGAHVEGEQPTATVTIQPSNHNNATPPAEVAPVFDPDGAGSASAS